MDSEQYIDWHFIVRDFRKNAPGEALDDTEGLQQMRTLARNMVFLMRAIADGKEKYGLPKKEPLTLTNFIR